MQQLHLLGLSHSSVTLQFTTPKSETSTVNPVNLQATLKQLANEIIGYLQAIML